VNELNNNNYRLRLCESTKQRALLCTRKRSSYDAGLFKLKVVYFAAT